MKIDYDLHIKKEQAHHRPRPEIVDEITESSKKIFEIKASNGKGKTFLLNLIALSLRGHELDNDDILESIKKSISRYSQSSNYDLEFEIEYDLPNGNSLKSSQIKGALVTTYIAKGIEGPPIDKRTLHKDFTILYDIPTDPSERLNGVIKNTKAWNNNLIQKYNGFIRFLSDIIRDFGDSIDLNKINKYEQNIEHLKSEKEITLSDISSVKRLLSNLNHADLLKKLQRSNKKIEKLESERTKITSELKKNPKPNKEEQKDSKTIASLNNSYDLESRKFKESITQLIETIETKPDIKQYIHNDHSADQAYDAIQQTEFRNIIYADDFHKAQTSFESNFSIVRGHIEKLILEEEKSDKAIIKSNLEQLLSSLENIVNLGLQDILENILNKRTIETIKLVEDKLSEYTIENYSHQKSVLGTTEKTVKSSIIEGYKISIKLRKEQRKSGDNQQYQKYELNKRQLEETKQAIRAENSRKTSIISMLRQHDPNLDVMSSGEVVSRKVSNLLEHSLIKKYSDDIDQGIKKLGQELASLKLKQTNNDGKINEQKYLLEMEKKKKTETYTQKQQDLIRNTMRFVQISTTNLDDFNTNALGESPIIRTEEDAKYFKVMGSIIAHSMNNRILRSDGKYINLENYDLLKKEFHCENDIIIMKDDISTGLASANYLMQRIENVVGKYVVILLDEIGNMSQDSMDQVIASIKKLEKQNRLVLAILAKPNSKGIEIIKY